ncbi:MAG TPA: hypothetical protein VF329_12430 [Gammaproteobacteria bacterium]
MPGIALAIGLTVLATALPAAADDEAEAAPATSVARQAHGLDGASEEASTDEAADEAIPVTAVVDAVDRTPESQRQECRQVKVTGSRIPKGICTTKEEWEAFSELTSEAGKEYLRRTRQNAEPRKDPFTTTRAVGGAF